MSKTTWADVEPGDIVTMPNGKPYALVKIKPKGKRAKITLADLKTGRNFPGEVKLTDKVKRSKIAEPLHDKSGAQQRWAKPAEAEPKHGKGLAPGDASVTKPPAKPGVDDWDTTRTRAEKKLEALLGARLVAEGDEAIGYYVPPVDITTIAAHMALCHPNTYDAAKDEATMLAGHAHEHKMVLEGTAKLGVNHWHTETRPKA